MRTPLIHAAVLFGLAGFFYLGICGAQASENGATDSGARQAAWLREGDSAERKNLKNSYASFVFDPAFLTAGTDSTRAKPRKKNPTGAMLRSLFLPGWGQIYNGQYLKAALVVAAETGLVATAIYWNQQVVKAPPNSNERLTYQQNRNTAYWFLAATVLLSMLDAYVDAHLSDFDESPELSLATPSRMVLGTDGLVVRVKIGF
jgi:hypothetical protein